MSKPKTESKQFLKDYARFNSHFMYYGASREDKPIENIPFLKGIADPLAKKLYTAMYEKKKIIKVINEIKKEYELRELREAISE